MKVNAIALLLYGPRQFGGAVTDLCVLVLEPKCQHASQGEKGIYLPFDSGEVLSGYLAYADYPNLSPWDMPRKIKCTRQWLISHVYVA